MKSSVVIANLVMFLIAAHMQGVAQAQEAQLPDQPPSLQAPPKVNQTPISTVPQVEVREETAAEAAARSKAQSEQARARETASKARIAVPKNARQWTGRILDAYPIDAKANGIEGTVGVSVTVGTDGRATNCKVIQSSGHPVLDDAACQGLERYARFEPALDREGKPAIGEFSTKITYTI